MSGEANLNGPTGFFRGKPFTPSKKGPSLLVASPHLTDDNFKRAVVLMLEHHAQGAVGMIINRPTKIRVSGAFQSPQILWSGDPDEVIWYGGPVMRESCWMLHEPMHLFSNAGTLNVSSELMVSSSVDSLQELSRNPPSNIRFIRGIAGWGASQLDREIASGMWVTADFSPNFLFNENPEDMWREAYKSLGVDPAFFAENTGIH